MKKLNGRMTDKGKRGQLMFADEASVSRTGDAGMDWKPIGALVPAQNVGTGCPVLVYNSGASVAFVACGKTETVTAPTSAANGVPVLAGQTLVLNSGENSWIISSSASVFGYTGDNDPT